LYGSDSPIIGIGEGIALLIDVEIVLCTSGTVGFRRISRFEMRRQYVVASESHRPTVPAGDNTPLCRPVSEAYDVTKERIQIRRHAVEIALRALK
jgi:hypothetical protein